MADSRECIHCGWYETPHVYPEVLDERSEESQRTRVVKWNGKKYRYAFRSCPGYADGVRHLKICPGKKYCYGNCEKAAADLEWSAKVQENRMQNVVYMVWDPKTGQSRIVVVDMGS